MSELKDILLKLHYLDLEINEIYLVLKKLFQSNTLSEEILRKSLHKKYLTYQQLDVKRIKENFFNHNIEYVTIVDENYPNRLENIFMPPVILFYQGDLSILEKPTIAMIGSRENTLYGEQVVKYFIPQLVEKNFTIVSGLAYGIDSISHRECIRCNGKTVAVLGSGLLEVYPKEHQKLAEKIAKDHLLISEYPPYAKPKKTHFPFRNRIVSGLSDGILVVEAKERSGTLITCDYALDQGKDIYVIPNQIFVQNSVGTNNLIKQGAKIVTNIFDILENFK